MTDPLGIILGPQPRSGTSALWIIYAGGTYVGGKALGLVTIPWTIDETGGIHTDEGSWKIKLNIPVPDNLQMMYPDYIR